MGLISTKPREQGAVGGEASSDDLSFLNAVLESTSEGILAVNLDGKFTGYNERFVEMWHLPREMVEAGQSDEAVLRRVVADLKDPQTFLAKVRDLYARIDASSFDTFEFKDGRVFERYSQPQVQDGKIVGRVWSFRDVTKRAAAEAARCDSEERLQMALSASEMGIWDWNIATGEVVWCENVDKVLEIPLEAIPNNLEAYRALVHREDLDQMDEVFQDILDGKIQSYCLEHRANLPNGKLKWLEAWGRVRCSPHGAPLHLIGAILDITTSKEREEEIRRLNRECESKVTRRTKQLQDAYQDLEAFSYSISHDLRAPLRHISGFAGNLLRNSEAGLDAETIESLTRIERASDRMGKMVEALLEFSRLGHKELSQNSLDLNALVARAKEELGPDTAGRNISWQIYPLPKVVGDEGLLRTAFVNLISNAIKFTRETDPASIEIGSLPVLKHRHEVTVFVRDNGAGFEMSEAGKLFGVFQRLHHQAEFEGTGVGLANVRRIIERHGGKIWAQAAPNRGATFYFTLPLVPGQST